MHTRPALWIIILLAAALAAAHPASADPYPYPAPPSEAPPSEAPPSEAPPSEAPPSEAPPSEAPPAEAAPSEAVAAQAMYLPLISSRPALGAPVLKWQRGGCFSSWCETGWYSSPAAADLDSDGQVEVVAAFYDLISLNGATGALEWRADNAGRAWPGVALADLTGNGSLEIIVGRSSDQLNVYTAAGSLLWTRHPFGGGEVRSLALADLDFNGTIEMIVGRASGGSTKQLSVYEPDGSVRPGWPARRDGEAGYGWGMYNQNAAAADLDLDGLMEIIGPTDTHYITALHHNGNQVVANSLYGTKMWSQVGVHVDHAVDLRGYANCGVEHRPNFADSAPILVDVDGNGLREIVVVGNVYNCGANPYQSLYHMVYILRMDRTRWSGAGFDWTVLPAPEPGAAPLSEEYSLIETAVPNPVAADLDGDGRLEILYASYDGRLHAYWLDKTEHGNWPYAVHNPSDGFIRFASEPVVADLDGNGQAEVIFASWVQKGTNASGRLHVLDYLGRVRFEVDLPAGFNANWNGAMAAPTLANLDGDPELEVALVTAHSGVVVYDLPGSIGARLLWPTGRGNYLRSGAP